MGTVRSKYSSGGMYRETQSERRYLFAVLREAGFTSIVAERLRDWKLESIVGQISIQRGNEFARDRLGVIDPRYYTWNLPAN